MPPKVAQKRSEFSVRLAVTTSPLARRTVIWSTHALKHPCAWWPLPWTSLAMQPPTVTNLVPGVTAGNQPRGAYVAMMSARLTPASQTSVPVVSSNPRKRLTRVIPMTRPPSLMEASP